MKMVKTSFGYMAPMEAKMISVIDKEKHDEIHVSYNDK